MNHDTQTTPTDAGQLRALLGVIAEVLESPSNARTDAVRIIAREASKEIAPTDPAAWLRDLVEEHDPDGEPVEETPDTDEETVPLEDVHNLLTAIETLLDLPAPNANANVVTYAERAADRLGTTSGILAAVTDPPGVVHATALLRSYAHGIQGAGQ